jgi:hypothetical protein
MLSQGMSMIFSKTRGPQPLDRIFSGDHPNLKISRCHCSRICSGISANDALRMDVTLCPNANGDVGGGARTRITSNCPVPAFRHARGRYGPRSQMNQRKRRRDAFVKKWSWHARSSHVRRFGFNRLRKEKSRLASHDVLPVPKNPGPPARRACPLASIEG